MTKVFVGWDAREDEAYRVCKFSMVRNCVGDVPSIVPLRTRALRAAEFYWREHDPLQSTDFTYTRFLVPALCRSGWALYMDCDMLVRGSINDLFALADPKYAVMVVKHDHQPKEEKKMEGAVQTQYPRKNWSSLILWNCDHKHVRAINWTNAANGKKAAALHQFQAFHDEEIGELPVEWNWLEGWNSKEQCDPQIVHFTRGGPWFRDWQDVAFADEWRKERELMRLAR